MRVSQEKFERVIDDKIVEGWNIKAQGERVTVLEKPGGWGSLLGHLVVFVCTFWWAFFIGNAAYALFTHFYLDKQELYIKVDE
jgi:hypothetical protein